MKVKLAILGFFVMMGTLGYVLFHGPEMKEQPSIRAFHARMPLPPPRSVPLENPRMPVSLPSAELGETNLARGKVYYDYYCVFCHGDTGTGDGPVGQSYMPVPTALNLPRIRAYTDEQYMRAMLAGVGHAPVLERIVLPEHRPYLLLYARQLGKFSHD